MKFSIVTLVGALLVAVAAASAFADDAKSCAQVIANMEESGWQESAADLAKALGVNADFVSGCVAGYKHSVALEKENPAKPGCRSIVAAVEEAGGAKSTDQIAADLKVTPERVRNCWSLIIDKK